MVTGDGRWSPAPSARRSSGTTSSSTARRPPWSSPQLFFPEQSLRRARCRRSAPVRRLRRPPDGRGDLRPLRRPRRPQGHADHDADPHGRRDRSYRRAARLRHDRRLGADPAHVLRIVQGIGVGGEWGGSVLMSMEWGRADATRLHGQLPQLGVPIGLLLSTGDVRVVIRGHERRRLRAWGWRIPFLISVVLVGIGLYVRLRRPRDAAVRPAAARSNAVVKQPVLEVIKQPPAGDPHLGVRPDGRAGAVLPLHHLRARLRHRAPRAADATDCSTTRSSRPPSGSSACRCSGTSPTCSAGG